MNVPARHYREYLPHPTLRPWILNYWRFATGALAADAPPHTVWPDGCTSVALLPMPVPGPRIFVTGPRVTAMQPPLYPHTELWGLRLWPDTPACVLDVPARTLRDREGPADGAIAAWATPLLAALDRTAGETERVAALDAQLLLRAASWPAPDQLVRTAVSHIVERRGDVSMAQVAAQAGTGLRQLQRRFPTTTGLTLREWARVRRLRESLALRLRSTVGWSAIAAESGFSDHAHLTREYQRLVGLAPTRVADALSRIAHENVRP